MNRALASRAATHSARGRRTVNQDAVAAVVLEGGAELVAVADGMGGHRAGEVASARALEALQTALTLDPDLVRAVQYANTQVLEAANAEPEFRGMGTTLVALLQQGDTYRIANVGDSRAYRVDARGIRQITRDHSFVAEAVGSGELTLQDAERSRWRHAVTRSLGMDGELEVDSYGPYGAGEAHAILLCTDGVHRFLSEAALQEVIGRSATAADAVCALVEAAHERGSDDNMSAALIQLGTGSDEFIFAAGGHAVSVAGATAGSRRALPLAADPAFEGSRRRRRARAQRRTIIEAAVIVLATIATVVYVAMRWLVS